MTGTALVLVATLAIGWPSLVRSPAPRGAGMVIALAGLAAILVAWLADSREFGETMLSHLPLVAAFALVAAVLVEMARPDGRAGLVESMTGTVTGAVVAIAATGWLAVLDLPHGDSPTFVLVAAFALAAASGCCTLLGRSPWLAAGIALVLGAAVGGVAGWLIQALTVWAGIALGLAAALSVAVTSLLLRPKAEDRRASLAAAATPVAIGGLLAYLAHALLG